MFIKNNKITRKQIIFTIIGMVLIYIGVPNIITSFVIIFTLINNPMTDPVVLSISVYPTLLGGFGFVIGGILLIYKSKLLQLFFTNKKLF